MVDIYVSLSCKSDINIVCFVINAQHNQLGDCRIPSWISCNLEGNNGDLDESAEMDVYEGDTGD